MAFARRAVKAHEVTNCLTEGTLQKLVIVHLLTTLLLIVVMILDALQAAEKLDLEFAQTGRVKGPLHGVPVSFKELCEHFGGYSTLVWRELTFVL